eukprot:CAMPEP_0198134982 /NCGR_PEP_ID=MMETSP1442-20131203/60358_1 /TAXON_ID= /ORGANISM="Craspedostauros australis, Strain CCMP3328" /LENGTH=417 /DNA_ID=CAMNT_0043796143 /DNA_START=70 /DNA_END=1323 /DNA_ORIENTATION=-
MSEIGTHPYRRCLEPSLANAITTIIISAGTSTRQHSPATHVVLNHTLMCSTFTPPSPSSLRHLAVTTIIGYSLSSIPLCPSCAVPEPEGNSTGIITGSFVMSELLQTVRAWQRGSLASRISLSHSLRLSTVATILTLHISWHTLITAQQQQQRQTSPIRNTHTQREAQPRRLNQQHTIRKQDNLNRPANPPSNKATKSERYPAYRIPHHPRQFTMTMSLETAMTATTATTSAAQMAQSSTKRSDCGAYQQQRKVRFNDQPTVSLVESLQDAQEKEERWYTSQNLKEIRQESSLAAFVMSELLQTVRAWQQLQKPQIHSVTMHISLRISIGMPLPLVDNGKAAPTCVRVKLAAQQREHKEMGIDDPKGLFQLSRRCSKMTRELAHKKAVNEAEEAKKISMETTRVIDDVLSLMEDMDL